MTLMARRPPSHQRRYKLPTAGPYRRAHISRHPSPSAPRTDPARTHPRAYRAAALRAPTLRQAGVAQLHEPERVRRIAFHVFPHRRDIGAVEGDDLRTFIGQNALHFGVDFLAALKVGFPSPGDEQLVDPLVGKAQAVEG